MEVAQDVRNQFSRMERQMELYGKRSMNSTGNKMSSCFLSSGWTAGAIGFVIDILHYDTTIIEVLMRFVTSTQIYSQNKIEIQIPLNQRNSRGVIVLIIMKILYSLVVE
jgi:hypothetical protein